MGKLTPTDADLAQFVWEEQIITADGEGDWLGADVGGAQGTFTLVAGHPDDDMWTGSLYVQVSFDGGDTAFYLPQADGTPMIMDQAGIWSFTIDESGCLVRLKWSGVSGTPNIRISR